MTETDDLGALVQASGQETVVVRLLECPCGEPGARVALGGSPAPRYTCSGCGTSSHDLRRLVATRRLR